ncbi:MAG: DUF2949 domain-containing protein [Cyanobacteria bacterium QH_8_48_120]|jgi:hypothetical protein|nr:MAG: DUF2949 domain-containing protein [Cyanobacteria bacterium QH_1_48_107]PSO55670.1 MAG: DUF2949 domain-containing protein [Cyanobacteria bacterium QH_10_48_56]PSO61483.1 MAG: DUF2949 domain-containing protein [Cyanobacteria bacterium QH_2_48_84]PSO63994.1 MAG: DUF2949 domain-containing protein [Cyanobacteria bacterium QH_6_48_35]PSO67542.1 MAG: DUF2949 domain-containing protein [Cyanobacteria bacterium QH_7_48_89]PSO73874.1 MAG: DUF2949 domain-containing protein [Cyanobacteria bacterium
MSTEFTQFLQEKLNLPQDSIEFALRHQTTTPSSMSIVLWQYGLISLKQLDQIFDWLEMG